MLILALETATVVSSVAVATEEKLLAEVTAAAKLTHSETLQPHIAMALEMAGVRREEIGAVAVSLGPGSFTGLRIGLAAAKAMAYAWQVPLVGVDTLASLAMGCPWPGAKTAALIDAQKGNVYLALYEWREGYPIERWPAEVVPCEQAIERLASLKEPVMLTGDIVSQKLALWENLPENLFIAPSAAILPRAASVAALGLRRLAAGLADNIMGLEPLYIRRSEAEVLWEKRHPEAVS